MWVLSAATSNPSWLDYVSRGGIAGLLALILYGGFKKNPWWVFGWVYRDLERRYKGRGEQLDKWWEMARRATLTAESLAKNKLPSSQQEESDVEK